MQFVLVPALAVATGFDWRYRKIPNWVTLPLILGGMMFHAFGGGVAALQQSFLGMGLGILLLYIPFILGGMGGGDVKLLGGIGAFVGPEAVFKVFLVSAIFGGIFSLIEVLRQRSFRQLMTKAQTQFTYFLLTHKFLRSPEEARERKIQIPYALALASGYLCVSFWGGGR